MSETARVYVSFLLHTHMPYVRKNGSWPVGEEWLLEAWAETYLPLMRLLEDMTTGGWGKLALTFTPVLLDQLHDDYMNHRLQVYLENKIRQCIQEIDRLERMGENRRRDIALFYLDYYVQGLELWGCRHRKGIAESLRAHQEEGRLEILASAATHAFLPLQPDQWSRSLQTRIGLDRHLQYFQRKSKGFWLPECALSGEMKPLIQQLSDEVQYVVLNHSALKNREEDSPLPHRIGNSSLIAIFRDRTLSELVWSWNGIPSHGPYREFSKRDLEGEGLQYWKITSGQTDLWHKEVYDPDEAKTQAKMDARLFVEVLEKRAALMSRPSNSLLLACYDTELLGHWWFEGIDWLRETLRLLHEHPHLSLCTPGEFVENMKDEVLNIWHPTTTSWGKGEDFSTWSNERTANVWRELYARCERLKQALISSRSGSSAPRPLIQALREYLLLQSSDWPFMIGRGEAEGYAWERFQSHCRRFDHCMELWESKREDGELDRLEEVDNLFSDIHLECMPDIPADG